MKYRLLSLVSVFAWSMTMTAQGLGESELIKQKQQQNDHNDRKYIPLVQDRSLVEPNAYSARSILQTSSDKSVAYYQNITKQYGWYVGIGPALTKEEVTHLSVVYKFSNKNNAGHWMKIETIDGYGDYTTDHHLETYIAPSSSNDSTINADWRLKLATICQWELMPDGSGETVIVERAYDAQNKLIYNYQPVYVSDREIIGSYTDSWGLSAKIAKKNGTPADVLVNIRLDQWGNDSIIKLVDTEGNLLMNSNGSWIVRNICDRHGNILENYALNQLGIPMNDNWGNCSFIQKTDEYGNTRQETYFDAGGNPVRLSSEYTFDDACEEHYDYDRWHRLISKSFFNGNNEPDTTSQGVHKIEYTYNDHGQILSKISRGLNNEPCSYGNDKSAFNYYQYNKQGYQTSLTKLGPDSTYLKSNYYYRMLSEYDGDNLKKVKNYNCEGSDTILNHYEFYSPEVYIYFQRNQKAYIDSLDQRGNILSRTYISNKQDPIALPDRSPGDYSPYARYISTYQYAPHSSTKVTTYYDKNGEWARSDNNYSSPACTVITTDSLQHTITHTEYSRDSIIQAHYQEIYDEHFSMVKYKQSLTTTGNVGRSGMNDAIYFKTKVEYSPIGKVASIQSLNEFDEPTYAYSDDYYYCFLVKDNSGKSIYYDENKSIVKKGEDPSASKAICLEIIRESGIKSGFKDGDILIRYGDWFYNHNQSSYYSFEDLFAQMVFSAAKDSIEIWLLRHFPNKKESKIIKLHVKGGTSSELGFATHEIYLTNLETQRYLRAFMSFKNVEELAGRAVVPLKRQEKHYARIIVPQYTNRSNNGYSLGWKNPVLLIAVKTNSDTGWPMSNNNQVKHYDGEFSYTSNKGIYLTSEDGIHLRRDSIEDYLFYLELDNTSVYITNDEHQMTLNLLEKARNTYPDDFIPNKNNYTSNVLGTQPPENALNAYEMIYALKNTSSVYESNNVAPNILNHIEDIDSTKVLKLFSDAQAEYRKLTYQLDKNYFTSQIAPKDSIAQKGITFLHETSEGIDEVLYLSEDTVVWAKGHMTHGSKNIIKKNMFGGEYNPLDKYNEVDLYIKKKSEEEVYSIAIYLQNYRVFSKSLPLLKNLVKRKHGPACTTLAKAYLTGTGVSVDTIRAISLYEKAIKYGDSVYGDLGKLYFKTHQYKSAISLLMKDTTLDSYEMLGYIYEFGGNGVKIDIDSAFYYYKKGFHLGVKYEDWRPFQIAMNRIRAKRVYTPEDFKELSPMVARSMSIDSLYLKGMMYNSEGNYINGYSYLKAAADSLYPLAEEQMAKFMEEEQFGFNDKQKAQEYRQRAITHYLSYTERGKNAGYKFIAELYATYDIEGQGPDMEKAKYYYKLGLQHNDVSAAQTLGDIYKKDFNYAEALAAYLVGAKAGNVICMYSAAQLYELNYNLQEAIYWYRECYQYDKMEDAKKALQRLGVPLVYQLKSSDLVGIWVATQGSSGVKVFLPNGYLFAFYGTNLSTLSERIKTRQFRSWFLGTYYVTGKNEYIEDIESRDIGNYLGQQHMTCQIDNNIMRACWENKSNERWEKQSDSNRLIQHIIQNWDSYKKYIQENLTFKGN